jgi:hypothetical protein
LNRTLKWISWIQRIILVVLLIFPLAFILVYQVSGLTSDHKALMLAPLFLTLAGFLVYIFLRGNVTGDWLAVVLAILLTIALRLAMGLLLSTDLVSDTLDAHLFAQDILSGNIIANAGKYTSIPLASYWNMMGVTLAGIYAIFGAGIRTAKLFMVVLAGLTGGLIYKVGKDAGQDHRVGLGATILFAVWPSLVCFTGIPTTEQIAMFLLIMISLVWLAFSRSAKKDRWGWSLLMAAILGVLVGLVDWYRPVGIIVLLAIILASLFSPEPRPKLPRFASLIAVLCACYFLVSGLSLVITEKMHARDLPSSGQRLGEMLLIGLDAEYDGQYNAQDHAITLSAYERFQDDYNSANRYLLSFALKRISQDIKQIPGLFAKKLALAWKNDDELFYFSLIGSDNEELVGYLKIINQWFLVMVTVLVIIFTLRSIASPPERPIFMMQLMILGLALLLLFTEVQARYRIILIPYLVVLAALGLRDATEIISGGIYGKQRNRT